MAKARQAGTSARVLLDTGDMDGACNRAYYAMFEAARAALRAAVAPPVELEAIRTHGGLITAFSLHLVKPGRIATEFGKSLNKVEELRLVADYKGDPIEPEDAAWAVREAQQFVQAIQTTFFGKSPKYNDSSESPHEFRSLATVGRTRMRLKLCARAMWQTTGIQRIDLTGFLFAWERRNPD